MDTKRPGGLSVIQVYIIKHLLYKKSRWIIYIRPVFLHFYLSTARFHLSNVCQNTIFTEFTFFVKTFLVILLCFLQKKSKINFFAYRKQKFGTNVSFITVIIIHVVIIIIQYAHQGRCIIISNIIFFPFWSASKHFIIYTYIDSK